jgi:hypothetical protein
MGFSAELVTWGKPFVEGRGEGTRCQVYVHFGLNYPFGRWKFFHKR